MYQLCLIKKFVKLLQKQMFLHMVRYLQWNGMSLAHFVQHCDEYKNTVELVIKKSLIDCIANLQMFECDFINF